MDLCSRGNLYYLCIETKGNDQLQLICVLVFAYARSRVSHEAAYIEGLICLAQFEMLDLLQVDSVSKDITESNYVMVDKIFNLYNSNKCN